MPYSYDDQVEMRDFHEKVSIANTDFGKKLLASSSVNDVATFVAKLGEECINLFTKDMRLAFPSAKIGAKTNVQRIA